MPVIANLLLSIGAMKAGTSWLYMLLREHPQIDTVPVKEIHYFAQHHTSYRLLNFDERLNRLREAAAWLRADQPADARTKLRWFCAFLADPVDDAWLAGLYRDPHGPTWCAEFSNLNTLLPPAGWQHVRRMAERVRVLYTVRNPLERLWSHARFHMAFTRRLHCITEWGESDFRRFLALPEIADQAHYARVLAMLGENFGPDEYHIIIHDEIDSTPHCVLAGIEAVLGISAGTYDPKNLVEHHNAGPGREMPLAFIEAVTPMVEEELAALDARGFAIPAAWRRLN